MSSTSEGDNKTPEITPTRNYTGADEQNAWWYVKRWSKDNKCWYSGYSYEPFWINKDQFRQRRSSYFYGSGLASVRINFQNNNEIGAFFKLTNSYALMAIEEESSNFSNTIKGDLQDIHVTQTSLAGCNVIGRMCVGNSKGLLVPDSIYDTEFNHIKNELPETIKIKKLEEQLSALGNVIVCNDHIALIHPDINKESEEIIADTLQVEVFRTMIGNNPLVGSYCVLNNHGGLVQPDISVQDLENLSSLLQIPLAPGTVNFGSKVLGCGLVVNDFRAYAGMKTTSAEFSVIDSAFQLRRK